ncbi:hypothetical protein [Nocardioides convexus]|uniref:hypothetical protein n=1 Tax=Nocardioides convexus TaxID=2712224 RepID=UPI0024185EB0|nr:hypothetical protein [Nocardioides convexus]
MAALLSDFGHDLPTIPVLAPEAKEPRLFRYAPRRGAARRGRGWAAASAPALAWRMTSDQAPVFWPFVSAPALPPTGAQMGVDQALRRLVLLRPVRMGAARRRPRHQPEHLPVRQAGQWEVGNHQGLLHPDDAVRLPHPGHRRRQGRVRIAVPRARRRAVRDRPRDAGAGQPAGHGAAQPRLGEALGRGGAAARHHHLQPVAGPGPRPGRQHEDRRRTAGAVRPRRVRRRTQRPGHPHRLRRRQQRPERDHHPAAVGPAAQPHRGASSGPASTRTPDSSSTRPGCCATRWAKPGHRHAGRPLRRLHQHRGRLARPDPVVQPLPTRRPRG